MTDIRLRVISLGAGVQSTTMALMAAHGEITPMPDSAISPTRKASRPPFIGISIGLSASCHSQFIG